MADPNVDDDVKFEGVGKLPPIDSTTLPANHHPLVNNEEWNRKLQELKAHENGKVQWEEEKLKKLNQWLKDSKRAIVDKLKEVESVDELNETYKFRYHQLFKLGEEFPEPGCGESDDDDDDDDSGTDEEDQEKASRKTPHRKSKTVAKRKTKNNNGGWRIGRQLTQDEQDDWLQNFEHLKAFMVSKEKDQQHTGHIAVTVKNGASPELAKWTAKKRNYMVQRLNQGLPFTKYMQERVDLFRSIGVPLPNPLQEAASGSEMDVADDEEEEDEGVADTLKVAGDSITSREHKNWMEMSNKVEKFQKDTRKEVSLRNGAPEELVSWVDENRSKLAILLQKVEDGCTMGRYLRKWMKRWMSLKLKLPKLSGEPKKGPQTKKTRGSRSTTSVVESSLESMRRVSASISSDSSKEGERKSPPKAPPTKPNDDAAGIAVSSRANTPPANQKKQSYGWDFLFSALAGAYKKNGKETHIGQRMSHWKQEQKELLKRVLKGQPVGGQDLERALKFVKVEEKWGWLDGDPLLALSQTKSAWSFMFGLLDEFHKTHKHSKVIKGPNGENALLAAWCKVQKASDTDSNLDPEQFHELDCKDFFEWSYDEATDKTNVTQHQDNNSGVPSVNGMEDPNEGAIVLYTGNHASSFAAVSPVRQPAIDENQKRPSASPAAEQRALVPLPQVVASSDSAVAGSDSAADATVLSPPSKFQEKKSDPHDMGAAAAKPDSVLSTPTLVQQHSKKRPSQGPCRKDQIDSSSPHVVPHITQKDGPPTEDDKAMQPPAHCRGLSAFGFGHHNKEDDDDVADDSSDHRDAIFEEYRKDSVVGAKQEPANESSLDKSDPRSAALETKAELEEEDGGHGKAHGREPTAPGARSNEDPQKKRGSPEEDRELGQLEQNANKVPRLDTGRGSYGSAGGSERLADLVPQNIHDLVHDPEHRRFLGSLDAGTLRSLIAQTQQDISHENSQRQGV